jgi:hypothetical protein
MAPDDDEPLCWSRDKTAVYHPPVAVAEIALFGSLLDELRIERRDLKPSEAKRLLAELVGQDPDSDLSACYVTRDSAFEDAFWELKQRPEPEPFVASEAVREPVSEPMIAGSQSAKSKSKSKSPARQPGTKPGTIDRHSENDAVCVAMMWELIIHGVASSPRAAALDLVEERQVPGPGSSESKAKRLAALYHKTYPRGR